MLVLGVILYMTALAVAIIGAAKAAGGNGRPTITNIKLDGPRSDLKLRFDVHADGVKTWRTIEVSVTYLRADMKPVQTRRPLLEHAQARRPGRGRAADPHDDLASCTDGGPQHLRRNRQRRRPM